MAYELTYELINNDTEYSVIGYTGEPVDVVIPNEYDGVSVTSIGDEAFYGCTSLTNITIPNSITNIGYCAFIACSNLKEIILPNSITTIGDQAFNSCTSLTSLNIPSSVSLIGKNIFAFCSNIASITVDVNNAHYKDIDGNLYSKDGKTFILYPVAKTATEFIIPDCVTSIGEYAFFDCRSLTSVVIPDSVTSIGSSAFSNCGLTEVEIPNGVEVINFGTFSSCDGLTSVSIPDNVTSIGNYAFGFCGNLTSVVIGNGVTSIGEEAFMYCESLTSVYYEGTAEEWTEISIGSKDNDCLINATRYYYSETKPTTEGNYWRYVDGEPTVWPVIIEELAYTLLSDDTYEVTGIGGVTDTDIVIPSEYNGKPVTSIAGFAFTYNTDLTSITIPSTITKIGPSAFYDCSYLERVYISDIAAWCNIEFSDRVLDLGYSTARLYLNNELVTDLVLPEGITTISAHAFDSCNTLTSIVIPDSVTSIGNSAFSYCSSLTSVVIPDSVTSIGDDAFSNCSNLTSVVIGDGVTSIGGGVFYGCSRLTSVVIGDSVTNIGDSAFSDCDSLTSVVIPDSVTSIGEGAFENCYSLTSMVIPDSVTSIGNYAFYQCYNLTNVTIGNNIVSVGSYAFEYCDSLTNVYLFAKIPATIMSQAFRGTPANFYCFTEALQKYKIATNWNDYADRFVADDLRLHFTMNAISTKKYVSREMEILKEQIVIPEGGLPTTATAKDIASIFNEEA